MKNVFNKALVGFFALSAIFEIQNSLPPTWDCGPVKVLANSLPPVPEYGKMRGIC